MKEPWMIRHYGPPLLARFAWWWLRRRGWLWQINTPEVCHDIYSDDRGTFDRGWRPLFSVRYGKQPVYTVRPVLEPWSE